MPFFAIFELSGPRGQKRGPETKKFKSNKDLKIYVTLKFEGPTLKNEKFQNFGHF